MHGISEKANIDKVFIEQMIERCYSIDQYVVVKNDGSCWAKLDYGTYSYRNHEGDFTEEKKLLPLKRVFKKLIFKHKNFEHQGYKYFFNRGTWSKYKIEV